MRHQTLVINIVVKSDAGRLGHGGLGPLKKIKSDPVTHAPQTAERPDMPSMPKGRVVDVYIYI